MKQDKLVSLRQAVSMLPEKDFCLALGGLTLYRRPMAFALALASQHAAGNAPQDVTLLCFTAGLESDILVGTGMVSRVRSCYFGLETFGLAPNFTARAAQRDFEIVEESEASLAYGLRASLAGVGFMPSTAWRGTDLPALRPDVKTVVDPYSGEELTAFPAIHCDVAVIHALEADLQGNASIGRNWGVDRELSLVAEVVIITAEKISEKLQRADIVGPVVDAVVEAPQGAWPTSCHPLYPLDGLATLEYTDKAGSKSYQDLIARWAQRHGIDFPAAT